MGVEEPGELPTCPRCRITVMWPVRDGWQCEDCEYHARADGRVYADAGRHADRGAEPTP